MLWNMDGLPVERILEIAARHGVSDVRVFGSRARGAARPDSDLDLLVRPGLDTTFLTLAALKGSWRRPLGFQWRLRPKARFVLLIEIASCQRRSP